MKNKEIRSIVLSGMFIAIGIALPFLTGQVPEIGSMLCPMHIPVLLCGFICGWKYGLIVGFVTPLLRSALFSRPPIYPTALAMAFELATYGLMCGILMKYLFKNNYKSLLNIIVTLIISMIVGRIVWGICSYILYTIAGNPFTFVIFLTGAFVNAWPGIVLQVIIIPILIFALSRTRLLNE